MAEWRIVFHHLLGNGNTVYVTYFVMNAVLLTAALKTLGLRFCIKTIYGVIVLTLVTGLIRQFVPNPTILHDQPFMTALIGAIFCGLGLGFCLSYNGSSGGSDIVAAIVNKYRDISLGRVIILVDMTIVTLSYLVLRSWDQVIYGYVCLIITALVLDQVVNAGRRSVQFLIISERYQEICDMISSTPRIVVVRLSTRSGYYSGKSTKRSDCRYAPA